VLHYIPLKSNITMKQNIRITAILNEPGTLRDLVENLASCHTDMGYCKITVPLQWKALEISSTEAFVRGAFDVHTKTGDTVNHLNIPFTTTFLFTCIKEKCGLFNLEWSLSLS
jgi:flagellar biosynthesis/type III secretory pathway M-ring protein FliF/YscJ